MLQDVQEEVCFSSSGQILLIANRVYGFIQGKCVPTGVRFRHQVMPSPDRRHLYVCNKELQISIYDFNAVKFLRSFNLFPYFSRIDFIVCYTSPGQESPLTCVIFDRAQSAIYKYSVDSVNTLVFDIEANARFLDKMSVSGSEKDNAALLRKALISSRWSTTFVSQNLTRFFYEREDLQKNLDYFFRTVDQQDYALERFDKDQFFSQAILRDEKQKSRYLLEYFANESKNISLSRSSFLVLLNDFSTISSNILALSVRCVTQYEIYAPN